MRSKVLKELVKDFQRHQAQFDVALGKPPRKSSKTYINAYANAYAQQHMICTEVHNNVCF